ncbi:MAG: taurine dioxygenase [Gammaproteobacteria bacterium]|jgi:taurine dioxygenase
MKFIRRSPHLGAFVEGIDLTKPVSDADIAEIHQGWLDHCVLFFRNQPISKEQHLELASRLGEIEEPHPVFDNDKSDARLTIIESKGREHDSEHYWHTDVTYQDAPSKGSILVARKIPESGGDTLFASMYAAYDTLSKPLQTLLESLSAQHSFERGWATTYRMFEGGEDKLYGLKKVFPLMTHPALRTHPETGRTALYVNEYYTSKINELSEFESDAVLKLLHHHAQLPDFQIRHQWQENDIAFWDNRCTQHYASNDYGAAHRIMNRVTLKGDKPYYNPL